MDLSASLFRKHASCGISVVGCGYGRTVGLSGLTPSIRTASTGTTRQQDIGDGVEDDEDQEQKHRKAASAEECDQAVEGLSTAKAKAKAKKLQESQRTVQSIIKKFWAKLLGVGPALRAVASMSRADWAEKFHHWKDEFVCSPALLAGFETTLGRYEDFLKLTFEACWWKEPLKKRTAAANSHHS